MRLPGPTWGSPVVVGGVLIEGDCRGTLHAFDVSPPRHDSLASSGRSGSGLHRVDAGGLEGTDLRRTRGGAMYALGPQSQT